MPSYHERIARAMKKSYSAGSLNSYETILAALHLKFPTEQQLREHVAQLESKMQLMGAPPGWRFIDDE